MKIAKIATFINTLKVILKSAFKATFISTLNATLANTLKANFKFKATFKTAATLALAIFLTPLTHANADEGDFNEYTNKMIIKLYTPDDFELIDLHQVGIDTKPKEPLFDSTKELERNNIYLQYEDTDKDFVLLSGYNEDLHLEFEHLSVSGAEFLGNIFEKFINDANTDKSLQLLNNQSNALYETTSNFNKLAKASLIKQFLVSPLLDLETSFDRMYVKLPEYILFIVLEECSFVEKKGWFSAKEMVSLSFRYKIKRLKDNKTLMHKRFRTSFEAPKIKDARAKYDSIALQTGERLKEHFAKIAEDLE